MKTKFNINVENQWCKKNSNDASLQPFLQIHRKYEPCVFWTFCKKNYLSYDVDVFQWITSCHKNRMTTRVITLLREYVTSLTTSVTTM